MIQDEQAESLLAVLRGSTATGTALRREAMKLLDGLSGYDWSGVYRLEGDILLLDEYVGAPTDHVRIPVGVGVCGTAVAENRNQVIKDVGRLTNYLSCSISTKAEIVVLVRDEHDTVLGQIDIDSHKVGNFDGSDEKLLEAVAAVLAARWQ